MERWNWFLSANLLGKWIIINGYAEVTRSDERILATLKISPDTPPHAYVDAKDDDDGTVQALVKSPDTPPYILRGQMYRDDASTENSAISLILTDGSTVLGLAKGSRTDESNLA
jgi:hypothetical protein